MTFVSNISLIASLLFSACTNLMPYVPVPVSGDLTATVESSDSKAVLLFGIGMHIEPQGQTHQGYKSGKGDYTDPGYFKKHVEYIENVVGMVNKHGGKVTIQAQSPFTDIVIENKNPILKNLANDGNEIALHFHEDAHLGKDSASLPVDQWCAVMKEEIALVKQASGMNEINFWSGGNLYPHLLEAAECAELTINSDWKNPQTQTTDPSLQGVHPWRPSGGTNGLDFDLLTTHDPNGPVVFLPEGNINRFKTGNIENKEKAFPEDSDAAFFEYLEEKLMTSLADAKPGK